MNPPEVAAKLAALLQSPAGWDAGFRSVEVVDGPGGTTVGVEVDGELLFVEVQAA